MMGSNHPVLNVKFFCGSLTSSLLADFMDWKEPKTECRFVVNFINILRAFYCTKVLCAAFL